MGNGFALIRPCCPLYTNASESEKIKTIEEHITAIKSSEEIGVKFMQEWEERVIEKKKAREEGEAAGRAKSIAVILGRYGELPAELKEKLLKEQGLEKLDEWIKYAVEAESIEAFISRIAES